MRRGQRSTMVLATAAAVTLVVGGSLGLAWRVGQEPPRGPHVALELAFTKACIDDFARRHGRLPSSIDDVVNEHRQWVEQANVAVDPRAPWLLDYPVDPWGTRIRFTSEDNQVFELDDGDLVEQDESPRVVGSLPDYELWSLGPDRIDGTRDDIYAR